MKYCVNHPGVKVHPPSKVLCKDCFKRLDAKFNKILTDLEENTSERKANHERSS